jgi:hypothetical protein
VKLKDDKVIVLRGGELASWIEESGVFCFCIFTSIAPTRFSPPQNDHFCHPSVSLL